MNPKRQQATTDARPAKRPVSPAASSLEALLARTKPELVELADGLGLKGVSKLAKSELARRVHGAQSAAAKPEAKASGPEPKQAKAGGKAEAKPARPEPKSTRGEPMTKAAKAESATKAARVEPPSPTIEPKVAKAEARAARSEPKIAKVAPPPAPSRPAAAEVAPPPPPPAQGAVAEPPSGGAVPDERPSPAATARLDLGGGPSPAPRREEHIPWSYGQDRVTAMAVDPESLYVYWEVTDPAIEHARGALGAAGEGAWLDLRVYDTTGIIFDGGNAHSWFDHGVGRSDRQWFFALHRPSSSVTVEVGMRAADGGFARIARSARVDFPRSSPASWGEPEWMTVLASGEAQHAGRGAPARPGGGDGHAFTGGGGGERHEHVPVWILMEPGEGERRFRELFGEQFERIEWQSGGGEGWYEFQGRLEWQVGPMVSSWEEGPFHYPVQVDPPTRASWEGGAIAYTQGGVTRVVYGPWAVVIKNLQGHASHAVLGRWSIYRSFATQGGVEELQRMTMRMAGAPGGASEQTAASGWLWQKGSELRLGGASELWRLGASEVRLRGASEVFYAGASERRLRGASERRLGGASEWRTAGASERRLGGASEQLRKGASEWRLGGASERQLAGASERVLGGASERLLGASEHRLGPDASAADDEEWDWEPPGSAPEPGRE